MVVNRIFATEKRNDIGCNVSDKLFLQPIYFLGFSVVSVFGVFRLQCIENRLQAKNIRFDRFRI